MINNQDKYSEGTKVYLTSAQLAERWQSDTGTLANMRSQGRGPDYTKPAGRILYDIHDVLRYEEEMRFRVAA